MGISVVNGYVCNSSCDVAKAKKGEDPHPALHAGDDKKSANASTRGDDPSVVFGGVLATLTDPSRVQPASASQNSAATSDQRFAIDLRV